ncbi:hypothetical protein V8F33_008979 [Rhypophila sp. PSN 637]
MFTISPSSSSSQAPPLYMQLLSKQAPNPQVESPLFNVFPAEIRSQIFTLALSDFVDTERQYDARTIYARPSYFAPRKSDLRLLRTCRAIYAETWHLPFSLREQTHWLTSDDRAPPEYKTGATGWGLYDTLRTAGVIKAAQGVNEVEIQSMRVFAQMWAIENGRMRLLMRDLTQHGVAPRMVTLTIRHTDWWWWENDHHLKFEGDWLADCRGNIPSSVREFHIELESLERKKDQVDAIAKQMAQKWYLVRKDGVALFPDCSGKSVRIDRWSGSSTWQGRTWIREQSAPGRIDYYIATVVFRPQRVVERNGGTVRPETIEIARAGSALASRFNMKLAWTPPPPPPSLEEGQRYHDDHDEDEDEDNEMSQVVPSS